jgi:hypothetical protein
MEGMIGGPAAAPDFRRANARRDLGGRGGASGLDRSQSTHFPSVMYKNLRSLDTNCRATRDAAIFEYRPREFRRMAAEKSVE